MKPWTRGFSLVEVLIAVVVLAFGLLGLAAVFPAVVRQQQLASDEVVGATVAHSALAYLKSHGGLNQAEVPGTAPANRTGWRSLTQDARWSTRGEWTDVVSSPESSMAAGAGVGIDPATGSLVIGQPRTIIVNNVPTRVGGEVVTLTERLWPNPKGTDADPKFVWDIAARRVEAGREVRNANQPTFDELKDDAVQVAVFVRRLDNGIRPASGYSLGSTLLGGARTNQRVWPVAVDGQGRPSLNGRGTYSRPLTAVLRLATVGPEDEGEPGQFVEVRSVSETNSARSPLFASLAQVGQKMVSPEGTVHVVKEVHMENNTVHLHVDPPMRDRAGDFTVVFTPQVPAEVIVETFVP